MAVQIGTTNFSSANVLRNLRTMTMGWPASPPRTRAATKSTSRTSMRRTMATMARKTTAAPRIKVIDRHPACAAGMEGTSAIIATVGADTSDRPSAECPCPNRPHQATMAQSVAPWDTIPLVSNADTSGIVSHRQGGLRAMLRILGSPKKLCDARTRRDFLCAGGLSLFGLGLGD